jgi:hypothetical protein
VRQASNHPFSDTGGAWRNLIRFLELRQIAAQHSSDASFNECFSQRSSNLVATTVIRNNPFGENVEGLSRCGEQTKYAEVANVVDTSVASVLVERLPTV